MPLKRVHSLELLRTYALAGIAVTRPSYNIGSGTSHYGGMPEVYRLSGRSVVDVVENAAAM